MKYKFHNRIIELPDYICPPESFTQKYPPLNADEMQYIQEHPNCTVADFPVKIIENE